MNSQSMQLWELSIKFHQFKYSREIFHIGIFEILNSVSANTFSSGIIPIGNKEFTKFATSGTSGME